MDSSGSGTASDQAANQAAPKPSSDQAAHTADPPTTSTAPTTASEMVNHATQTTEFGPNDGSAPEDSTVATDTQTNPAPDDTATASQPRVEGPQASGTTDSAAAATTSTTTMTGALPSDQEPPSTDQAAAAADDKTTDGTEAESKSEDTEKGDINFRPVQKNQKPGPSSSLTAAEWDGGMDKDDVPADFDPENDDGDDDEEEPSEAEVLKPEEKTAEAKKLEKGKGRAVEPATQPVKETKDRKPKGKDGDKKETDNKKDSAEKKVEGDGKDIKKLRLIDLPLDVLREIMREVTNTTDLCSLSLSHSSLHALAIPHIYSRFDIVWPDMSVHSDRTGVDALTYGLATLVSPKNSYARYIRKFSLGNGPKDWVNEYLISKEGGKMLGTLVSLAIYKMEALETFNWDMPTGVLRDVWIALHELQTVKNVHVRWHDNTQPDMVQNPDHTRRVETPSFSGFKDLKSISALDVDEVRYMREIAAAIENSFSTLRELRLGVAVQAQAKKWVTDDEASANSSQEGAGEGGVVGIAVGKVCDVKRRTNKPPADTATVPGPAQTTGNQSLTQEQLAAALQSQQQQQQLQQQQQQQQQQPQAPPQIPPLQPNVPPQQSQAQQQPPQNTTNQAGGSSSSAAPTNPTTTAPPDVPAAPTGTVAPNPTAVTTTTATTTATSEQASEIGADEQPLVNRQLKLETLELERVPLSTRVLTKAFDFTSLVSLTLLGCGNHAKLFKMLRRKYSPFPISDKPTSSTSSAGSGATTISKTPSGPPPIPNYKLKLKKIHTDSVSTALLSFISQTLAPNTLETLFLQEHQENEYNAPGTVTIPQMPLRRHRLSLKRVLIDSYVENPETTTPSPNTPQTPPVQTRKAKWKFNRESLTFVTERMPNLKEVGFAIDYRDWHFFLTRLPEMTSLRSLYIPHVIIGDGREVFNPERQAEEMAMQIVDVVTLRPECGVCYVGILNKCFELLESDDSGIGTGSGSLPNASSLTGAGTSAAGGVGGGNVTQPGNAEVSDDEDDDDDDADDDDNDDDGDDEDDDDEDEGDDTEDAEEAEEDQDLLDGEAAAAAASHVVKDDDGDTAGESGEGKSKRVRVKHREILFYEDKVAVFKARHARL